jgi:lipooligosaccharide transport system permease protein
LAANAMQMGTGESTYPVMAGFKWFKSYWVAIASPVTSNEILGGQILWALARVLHVSVVYAAVMTAFGAVTAGGAAAALVPAMFTGAAFIPPVMWYTATLRTEIGLANLFRFGILPLVLFSGTFFPISQLPDVLQPLAYLTPLWHGVDWARAWALGTSPTWPWWTHAAVLVGFSIVGFVGASRAFERKLVV